MARTFLLVCLWALGSKARHPCPGHPVPSGQRQEVKAWVPVPAEPLECVMVVLKSRWGQGVCGWFGSLWEGSWAEGAQGFWNVCLLWP